MAIRAIITEPVTASLLLATVLAAIFIRSWRAPRITRHGKPLRTPPNTLPLLGNGIIFLQPRQRLFAWFTRCIRLHGHETLAIAVPSLPPGVVVADPACLDFIFRHEGVFEKGNFFKDRSQDLFGNGIINVDGEAWRVQRRAGLRFLSGSNLGVLTGVLLPRLLEVASVQELERRADDHVTGGVPVDLQEVVHGVTTQLMGRMAYGMDMQTGDDFTEAFEHASGATAERFQNPLWFVTELVAGARLRRSIRVIKDYGRTIVARAKLEREGESVAGKFAPEEEREGRADNDVGVHTARETTTTTEEAAAAAGEIAGSLINSLLDSIQDDTLVADSALNYLSAGRDTVAQALTWTFYLLMRHTQVQDRVRHEVRERTSREEDTRPTSALDPEHMTPTRLPYVAAVFYESLRLYPPIPFEIKQAQQDTCLPDGTFLPRSSIVLWCAWAMNRSRLTWGDDADEFRPERWLSAENGQLLSRSAAEFPVFNGGSRLCLGKKMAELVAIQVIATWSIRFRFRPAYEGERVSKSSLTLPMVGGLPVFVERLHVENSAATAPL